jgi:SAM-dependent methyltransferase
MPRLTCCRSCGGSSLDVVLDLGLQPIANAFVEEANRDEPEDRFPLEIAFCQNCALVQVTETIDPDVLFGQDYPYFSSFIPALLIHSRHHAEALVKARNLGANSLVVEVASNDGYLLKNFVEAGVPVLGVDPARGPAEAAQAAGVPTLNAFFNAETAAKLVAEGKKADVILANNVLAHVDGINAFVEGFSVLLKDDGIAEFEFPYLRDLIESCAFDTIYHEHVFYYSLAALEPLFNRHGLHLNDVQRIDIHGGSLRLTVSKSAVKSERLEALQAEEAALGMDRIDYYRSFGARVAGLRERLRSVILDLTASGARVAAYGAAAKGVTLLNYLEIGGETLTYAVDRNVHKVGKLMPGLKLLVRETDVLGSDRPDYVLILAWNFGAEIMQQQKAYIDAGGRFILPIPEPVIVDSKLAGQIASSPLAPKMAAGISPQGPRA